MIFEIHDADGHPIVKLPDQIADLKAQIAELKAEIASARCDTAALRSEVQQNYASHAALNSGLAAVRK